MTEEEVVEYALSPEAALLSGSVSAKEHLKRETTADNLTHRERQVAILAARGLKDQQIAKELSISEHAVSARTQAVSCASWGSLQGSNNRLDGRAAAASRRLKRSKILHP
jgi:FixJ family two-component response regulator